MFQILGRVCVSCLSRNALVYAGGAIALYGYRCVRDRKAPTFKDAVRIGAEGAVASALIGPITSRLVKPILK